MASFLQRNHNDFAVSSASFSVSFVGGTTAGSIIIVAGNCDPAVTSVTFDDGKGDTPTTVIPLTADVPQTNPIKYFCAAFLAATAGATTVTVTFHSVNAGYGEMFIWEGAGLTSPTVDKALDNQGLGTGPDTGSTGTLAAAVELAICYASSSDHITGAGSGWTNWIGGGAVGGGGEEQVTSANTALHGTQNTFNINTDRWDILIATFYSGASVTLNTAWLPPSPERIVRKFPTDTCAAIALTPATLPPKISGMGWFEPPDRDKLPTKITIESPPAIALTPATLPPKISGMAWFEPPDRDKPATKVLFDQLPAPMGTSFPRVYGIGWFAPPDKDKPAVKVSVESPPAFALTSTAYVYGIGWHNPPDRDKKATRITIEAPPAIALTPDTLPPKIAGMAWFAPPNVDRPAIKLLGTTTAWNPQVTTPVTAATPTGWFVNPEIVKGKPVWCEQPAGFVSNFQTAGISGIAWAVPTDSYPSKRIILNDPTEVFGGRDFIPPVFVFPDRAKVATPPNVIPSAWNPQVIAPAVTASPNGWFGTVDVYISRKLFVSDPIEVVRDQSVVLGLGWFNQPDRDKVAIRVNVETLPALALTPDTLPPKISGMAWFQPWEPAIINRGVNWLTAPAWNPQFVFQVPPPAVTEIHSKPFLITTGRMMSH